MSVYSIFNVEKQTNKQQQQKKKKKQTNKQIGLKLNSPVLAKEVQIFKCRPTT